MELAASSLSMLSQRSSHRKTHQVGAELDYLGLPDGDQLFQGVASSETGQLVEPPRIHSTFSFVQGRVCGDCNSGWMSRLEGAAKPLLTALIDQQRGLASLSGQEAALVGRWAAKTAYLHTWAGPLKQPVQLSHLKALSGDAGDVAAGVGVFGMQSEYAQPSGYIQTGHWPQFAGTETAENVETPSNAYKVGLQFRSLYLLVAFWPNSTSVLTRVKDMHVRLIPPGPDGPEYEIQLGVGAGPIDRLATFANWLGVWDSQAAV